MDEFLNLKLLQNKREEMSIVLFSLQAKNYGEVLTFTKDAQTKLKKLGCFKRVDGYIDTSNDPTGITIKCSSLF